ncbi:MAG: hypothetical protein Fur0018_21100 [Anaerolineales bacterium]
MDGLVETYISTVRDTLVNLPTAKIEQLIDILTEARLYGRQVFIMGNGGSASTASHFVCDLAKNTRRPNWPHFRVIGLTDNMAIFSAYANDEGYENVFAEQLGSLLEAQDVVIGISASGNSENVLRAIRLANKFGAYTVGLTGFSGGELAKISRLNIHVPLNSYEQVEDIHLMIEHMVVAAIGKRCQAVTILPQQQLSQAQGNNVTDNISLDEIHQRTALEMAAEKTSQRARQTMNMLSEISQEFARKLDLHTLLGRVLLLTLDMVGAISGSIMVLDGNGILVDGALAYNGNVYTPGAGQMKEMADQGLAGWVIEHRQPALITNTSTDPRWLRRSADENERSVLSVPLVAKGRVVGVVTLGYPQAGRFTMEDLAMLTAIAVTLSYSFGEREKV